VSKQSADVNVKNQNSPYGINWCKYFIVNINEKESMLEFEKKALRGKFKYGGGGVVNGWCRKRHNRDLQMFNFFFC
jgi:hypothetical protein